MVLCQYTITIEIPDTWPASVQERALDAVDTNDVAKQIENHTHNVLNGCVNTRGATAKVED